MEAEAKKPPLPLQLKGVQEQDHQLWRHHPVTKVYRQYLKDFREALRQALLDLLEAGNLDEHTKLKAEGKLQILNEMIHLEYDHLVLFYEAPLDEAMDEMDESMSSYGYDGAKER